MAGQILLMAEMKQAWLQAILGADQADTAVHDHADVWPG